MAFKPMREKEVHCVPSVVAFTGHRPNKLNDEWDMNGSTSKRVRDELHAQLVKLAPTAAISGFALGVDMIAAQLCIDLGIPLIAAIPFQGQESKWPDKSQRLYRALLERASAVTYVSPPGYNSFKMQTRNEWMVDHCGTLLCVWDGTAGGTANCLGYAVSSGRRTLILSIEDALDFTWYNAEEEWEWLRLKLIQIRGW